MRRNEKGSVLVLAMVVMVMILFLAGIFLQLTLQNFLMLQKIIEREKIYWVARAGLSKMTYELRRYYFTNQQKMIEEEFGGGKYKVGVATLIGQGFHKSLIVSLGEYKGGKRVLGQTVEVNTSTDYLHFREGNEMYQANQGGPIYLVGPVHVNGDVLVGMEGGGDYFFIKSNQLYGPVLETSGYIYNRVDYDWIIGYNIYRSVGFGEGDVTSKNPYRFNLSDLTSVFYAANGANRTLYWPGRFRGPYKNEPWAYVPEQFPTEVEHFTPGGKPYKYPLVQCKSNGGRYIKIPPTTKIDYNYYRPYIDEEWHITEDHPVGEVINIINEGYNPDMYSTFGAKATVSLGNVTFGATGFDIYYGNLGYDTNTVQFIIFENSETDEWSSANKWWFYGQLAVDATRRHYPPPGSGAMSGTSYTIDRKAQKFVFKYPICWNSHAFKGPPKVDSIKGEQVWPGEKIWHDKWTSNGGANQQYNTSESIFCDSIPSVDYPVKVWVTVPGPPEVTTEWTQAPGNSLLNQPATAQIFKVDYSANKIIFGTGVDGTPTTDGGAIPPAGSTIWCRYSHGFKLPIRASMNERIKVVSLDLNKITKENHPKDPQDPANPNKYGVIFSELPLVVKGVPEVPVTIVGMEDIYLGPVNANYLRENLDPKMPVAVNLLDDPDNLQPVGIICKKILWMDYTYAPVTNQSMASYLVSNTFQPQQIIIGKTLKLNKVAIYAPAFRPTYYNLSMAQGANVWPFVYAWERDLWFVKVKGAPMIGITNTYDSGRGFYNEYMDLDFCGSIYTCEDKELEKWSSEGAIIGGKPGNESPRIMSKYSGGLRAVYANSLRYNPPPHMPIEFNITSFYGNFSIKRTEEFFDSLSDLISKNEKWSIEYENKIEKLLTSYELGKKYEEEGEEAEE